MVYAVLWAGAARALGERRVQRPEERNLQIHRRRQHWTPADGGLPAFGEGLGRIGIGIAPSDPNRMFAMVEAGRDAGGLIAPTMPAHWKRVNNEDRSTGRGSDFACVRVDPKNKDVIYVANTSTYRSTDGGQTFTAIKGAPGGDDYHTIWINPKTRTSFCWRDQGATISVNGGATWSSWYNQPTRSLTM